MSPPPSPGGSSSVGSTGGGGGDPEALRRMTKVVNSLLSRGDSGPFREPVDWRGLELYDYPKIIKKVSGFWVLARIFFVSLGSVGEFRLASLRPWPKNRTRGVRSSFSNKFEGGGLNVDSTEIVTRMLRTVQSNYGYPSRLLLLLCVKSFDLQLHSASRNCASATTSL